MGVMVGEKLYQINDGVLAHWCQACRMLHPIHIGAANHLGARWSWNQDVERPTFTPSVNVARGMCHYFITDGQIIFTSDCHHQLAGQTVPLLPIPDDEKDW